MEDSNNYTYDKNDDRRDQDMQHQHHHQQQHHLEQQLYSDMEDLAFLQNASASYRDIETSGEPCDPLLFDQPYIGRAAIINANVLNPNTLDVLEVSNIVFEQFPDGRPPKHGYWIGRKIKECIFGVVKECTVLKFRNDENVPWEVTEKRAAVKIMSWQKIKTIRHIENPLQEVAAMQYVSRDGHHPHVIGVLDVLEDEQYILMFIPFCTSGDLFSYVQAAGRFPEPMARYWFRQILEGLTHLQRKGVCHRDLSLENILIDEYKTSVIIDLGMCLKVPFDAGETGLDPSDVDVSFCTLRRLIKKLVPCGKPNYISPEVLRSEGPFDGFAIDLWAAAVILFIMLVGLPPWEFAHTDDERYKMITRGGLTRMLRTWNKPISPLAADLLQRMFREDPRERLNLIDVKDHPWVANDDMSDVNSRNTDNNSLNQQKPSAMDEGWRNTVRLP